MNELCKNWIIKGKNDLKVASDALKVKNPVTDAICFHCQQSVEKFLKAYLCINNQEIPRIHDLTRLIDLCISIDKEFKYLHEIQVDLLTDYAVEIRYPDDFYIPTVVEAKEAYKLANKAKNFILKKIKEITKRKN